MVKGPIMKEARRSRGSSRKMKVSRRRRRSVSRQRQRQRQRSSRKTQKQKQKADTFNKKKSGAKRKRDPFTNQLANKKYDKIRKKQIFDRIIKKFIHQGQRALDSINPTNAIPNALNFLVQYILSHIRGIVGTLRCPDDEIIIPTGNSLFSKLLMMGVDVIRWAGKKTFSSCQIVMIIASKIWVHGVVYKLFAAVDAFFEMVTKYKTDGPKVPGLIKKLKTDYGIGPEHFNLMYVNPDQPSPARSEVDENSVTIFIAKMEEFEKAFNEIDKVIFEMMKTWNKTEGPEGPEVYPIAKKPIEGLENARELLIEDARKYTKMVDGRVMTVAANRMNRPIPPPLQQLPPVPDADLSPIGRTAMPNRYSPM